MSDPQTSPIATGSSAGGSADDRTNEMHVSKIDGKSAGYAIARSGLEPEIRHAALTLNASADLFDGASATVPETAEAIGDMAGEAATQDLSSVNRLLTAQALSLDALFTQMARKAHANVNQYPDAAERYMRLAFKAQAQSRATLEALVKMHQPREQTVRHVHVGPNGQAVFIENLNGGMGSVRSIDQAHAQSASGAALLGYDQTGNGLPITSGEREAEVPNARRRGRQRRTSGK